MRRRHGYPSGLLVALCLILAACQPAAGPSPTAPPPPPTAPPPTAPAAASPKPAASPAAIPSPSLIPSPSASPSPAPAAAPLTGTLTVDLDGDLESLDPYLAYTPAGLSIHHNLFDYLLERDPAGQLAPGLAESWRAVDDTTLELNLRHGVKFHNGDDFDARSVQLSTQRMLDPALNSGVRSRFTSIAEVRVLDPFTVQLVLGRPDTPTLLDSLTNQLAMLPPSTPAQGALGRGPWARALYSSMGARRPPDAAGERVLLGRSVKGQPRVRTVVLRPVPGAATPLADLRSGLADLVVGLSRTRPASSRTAGAAHRGSCAPMSRLRVHLLQ